MRDVYSAVCARCRQLRLTLTGLLLPTLLMIAPLDSILAQPDGTAMVYIGFGAEEVLLGADSDPVSGKTPVLFVHGHDSQSLFAGPGCTTDENQPNYKKNWQLPCDDLPSFSQTLAHADNAGLDIEPYFIHFEDQNRSIVEDARDIEWAVEYILKRHDTSYDPFTQDSTGVKIAIVGYSKGTISTRCYLKRLQPAPSEPGPCNFGVPRDGFNPVSEFVAIAPPNHGINILSGSSSLAVNQLKDGYRTVCPFTLPTGGEFISTLNGHSTTDSERSGTEPGNWVPGPYGSEAPGIRANDSDSDSGTLYLSLYADGTLNDDSFEPRDFVGGHYPSDDCRGRKLARNLASGAVNIPVSTVPVGNEFVVHRKTVHTPRVICLALYAVSHHNFPTPPESVACETDGQIPLVPLPPPWWWSLLLIILSLIVVSIVVVVLYVKPEDG